MNIKLINRDQKYDIPIMRSATNVQIKSNNVTAKTAILIDNGIRVADGVNLYIPVNLKKIARY
jgi:hypothetical protein